MTRLPLSPQREWMVAGVMSGTSLDGVDVAIAHIAGHGPSIEVSQKGFSTTPYCPSLRTLLMEATTSEAFSITMLSQLNVRVAHEYARCVLSAMKAAGVDALDLVGSHGQTIRHVPDAAPCAEMEVASTLQIGDPSVLANLLRVPVVGDFRMADIALGGQGAPLVPYYDYVVFGDKNQTRGLLNVGGIANLTVLPSGGNSKDVSGFDTGCGNMILDALAELLLGMPFDRDGRVAALGRPSEAVLSELLRDTYFLMHPPKSTGRERYGPSYVRRFLAACSELSKEDILATATALTARAACQAYRAFVQGTNLLDVLIVSGGGRRNKTLMRMLQDCFAPVEVAPSDAFGVDSDAKEALCFAVLAHETISGRPTNMPGATGALRPTILGKICLPG